MLCSFLEAVPNLSIFKNVYVNIDPFFGDRTAQKECSVIIKNFFENAFILMPKESSFGSAVKNVWSKCAQNVTLHLEDDWVFEDHINLDSIKIFDNEPGLGSLKFATKNHENFNAASLEIVSSPRRRKEMNICGLRIIMPYTVNSFGTSPRLIRGGLAQKLSAKIDPNLDPEKQIYRGVNWPLCKLQEQYKEKILFSKKGKRLITDIGRQWQRENRIKKINRGAGVWWEKLEG